MAKEPWDDLFVRTSLTETSPDNRSGGWSSPDIIPTGTKLRDPADFITAASYGRYYNEALYEHRENYIYVRAKNSSPSESSSAKIWTVVRDPAIVLWPEEGWPKLRTSAGLDYSVIDDIKPGEIGVTGLGGNKASAPFTLIPDFSGHRCLISWLSTTRHPAPEKLPTLKTAQELTDWMIAHPNYANQNIDVVADTTGTQTIVKPFQSGDREAKWVFQLTVQGCAGFTVGFACATPLASGQYIQYGPSLVTQNERYTITIERTVEAGFNANISYFYDQRNNALPDDFYIGFQAGMLLESGNSLYEYGRPYEVWDSQARRAVPTNNRAFQLGSVGVMKETER